MSRVIPAKGICELSLAAIGELPVTESSADGEALRRSMEFLDLLLAQLVGTHRMFSRIDATLSMPITNGTQSYNLYTALGDDLPADRIQFVTEAYLETDTGRRFPIEIVRREKFENVPEIAQEGVPTWIYIDRLENPTLQLYPTPSDDDTTEYTLKLVCQLFAPNVAPGGVTGTQPQASVLHKLGQAWQRFLVFQLAHDLGSGPITKIAESSLTRFLGIATDAKTELLAFENREQQTTPPIVEAWGD